MSNETDTKLREVEQFIEENGPATSEEAADAMGRETVMVSSLMSKLHSRGRVARRVVVTPDAHHAWAYEYRAPGEGGDGR